MVILDNSFRFVSCLVTCAHIISATTLGQQRRIFQPHENIADFIRQATSANEHEPARFTITAQVQEGPFSESAIARSSPLKKSESKSATLTMDVMVATPAVTSATQIVLPDGSSSRLGDPSLFLNTLLVSDTVAASGHSGVTILTIDQKTNDLYGITENAQSRVIKIRQAAQKGIVTAMEDDVRKMPAWECAVGKAGAEATLFHRDLQESRHNDGGEHDGKVRMICHCSYDNSLDWAGSHNQNLCQAAKLSFSPR